MIPNRIDIPFSDNLVSEIRFRMPAGILRVFVLEAKDLGNILKWFFVAFFLAIVLRSDSKMSDNITHILNVRS